MSKFEDPNERFNYDESSPSCLVWKKHKRHPSQNGKPCGTITHNSQWAVQFRGMPRMAHRLIWEMFHGHLDSRDIIRTKDGNYLNCKIDNLVLEKYSEKNLQMADIKSGNWKNIFNYKDGMLYWKDSFWSGTNLQVLNAAKGAEVHTTPDKDGYLRVKLGNYAGYMLMLHRIIYEWHHGKIPDKMQIDHINGINTDNTIENLRCVNAFLNARNRKMDSRNKTGVTGVRLRKDKQGVSYIAIWRDGGKEYQKSFSSCKYGEQKAFELACATRASAIEKHNIENPEEQYTQDHGKRN